MSNNSDSGQNLLFYRIKSVTKHSMVYGVFDFLGKAGALILVPLYAKVLGPAEYGLLEIFTVTGALLLITSVVGFNSALTRYYVTESDEDERNKIFQTAFFSTLIAAGIIALLLSSFAPLISQLLFSSGSYANYWRLLFATVFSDAATTILLALYRSQTRPGLYAGVNFFKLILTLILNVLFVGFLRQGVSGVLVGNLIGSVCGLALGLVFCARLIRLRFSRKYLVLLARFGLPLLVSGFAFFVINSADRYFLKVYTGLADLGAYALGYKVGMLMSLAVNAFVVAWLPLMFKIAQDPQAKKTYATVLTYYLFVTGFLLVAVGSFSHEIVGLIGTPEYSEASKIVLFVLLSYMFQGAYYIMTTGVLLKDQTKAISAVAGISAIINIVANFLLIPAYGIMGAAVATLISYAFLPIGIYFPSQRLYRVNFESYRIAKVVVAATLILLLNNVLIGHSSLPMAAVRLFLVLVYPALLLLFGFFTDEELERGKLIIGKIIRRIPAFRGR